MYARLHQYVTSGQCHSLGSCELHVQQLCTSCCFLHVTHLACTRTAAPEAQLWCSQRTTQGSTAPAEFVKVLFGYDKHIIYIYTRINPVL